MVGSSRKPHALYGGACATAMCMAVQGFWIPNRIVWLELCIPILGFLAVVSCAARRSASAGFAGDYVCEHALPLPAPSSPLSCLPAHRHRHARIHASMHTRLHTCPRPRSRPAIIHTLSLTGARRGSGVPCNGPRRPLQRVSRKAGQQTRVLWGPVRLALFVTQ